MYYLCKKGKMLQRINIKNFRSLRDVTVDLQQVNLLIGPNNSGKTNFLKVFEFLSVFLKSETFSQETFSRNYFGFWEPLQLKNNKRPISFSFTFRIDKERWGIYLLEIFGASDTLKPFYRELSGISKSDFLGLSINDIVVKSSNLYKFRINFVGDVPVPGKLVQDVRLNDFNRCVIFKMEKGRKEIVSTDRKGLFFLKSLDDIHTLYLTRIFESIIIYQPDISKLKVPGKLGEESYVDSDGSNLVSFLDNMRDQSPEIYDRIITDFKECLKDFKDIRFRKVKNNGTIDKVIGLLDQKGRIFWANELSEGTLYFLALLSIIHQPNPPKLLLLEEPEKGIHPRRIHEVMEYIFRLAEEKEIQIILTTHNTQLVDEFEDIPQSVFIFEMINGETKIKNLLTDVIEPANKKSKEKGLPFIKYTELLGEKWFQGFIGGVP